MGDLRSSTRAHPKDVPLSEWPDGWLVMEVASLLDDPGYIIAHDHERKARGLPSSKDERLSFVASKQ